MEREFCKKAATHYWKNKVMTDTVVGALVIGGIYYYYRYVRREKNGSTYGKKEFVSNAYQKERSNEYKTVKAHQVSENKGHDFENYVVERFNPPFNLLEWRGDKYHEGHYAKSNMLPDLEVVLETKYRKIIFAVECKWRSEFYNGNVEWCKDYQLKNYRDYEHERNNPVFVLLGIGGEPCNPTRVYIIPLCDIYSTSLSQHFLQKYFRYKKGNFFFHIGGMMLE